MSGVVVNASASETGESAFAVRIETGGHVLTGDEPVSVGGGGLGPAPYQLLAAALAECTAMTLRWYARQQQWPVEHVAVDVLYEKGVLEGRPGKTDIFTKTIHVTGPDLTVEQRQRLLDIAASCPVQRTLEGVSSITTSMAPY